MEVCCFFVIVKNLLKLDCLFVIIFLPVYGAVHQKLTAVYLQWSMYFCCWNQHKKFSVSGRGSE